MPALTEIFADFGSIAVLIIVGWLLERSEIIDKRVSFTLNMVVFWTTMPCVLAHTLATAGSASIFGSAFGVTVLSTLGTAAFYRIFVAPMFKQRDTDTVVDAMSPSYNNVVSLGVPIVVAVLRDATTVVPALIFQVAFYAPASMTVLEVLTNRGHFRPRNVTVAPLKNPIFLAAMMELAVSAFAIEVPQFVARPVRLLGQATVPIALLAFSISLYGTPFMEAGRSSRRAVVVASTLKLFLYPTLALLFDHFVFSLSGHVLLAAMIITGLPTARNVYTFASRFGRNLKQARDYGVITTITCLPTVLLFILLLNWVTLPDGLGRISLPLETWGF